MSDGEVRTSWEMAYFDSRARAGLDVVHENCKYRDIQRELLGFCLG